MQTDNVEKVTRKQFLSVLGATAVGLIAPHRADGQTTATDSTSQPRPRVYDLRDFVNWIVHDYEPSVKLPGPAGNYARQPGQTAVELYGISDMACILYTLGRLRYSDKERAEWAAGFQAFQVAGTGMLVEKVNPTHDPLHNTAFALAAMELLDLKPANPVTMGSQYKDPRAFLNTLDWKKTVYSDSHKGAGIGAIYALVPELGTPAWFAEYFATCDELFDPNNGMMGRDKPRAGDNDQIGGTFHYSFLYGHFNRHMPYPEQRIDSIIGLQQADGYWHPTNHNWMTLDALYMMTRALRLTTHRRDDVIATVRRTMDVLMQDMYSPAARKTAYSGRLGVHALTCAISIAAELQQFLGAQEVVTEWPLKLVLDRRPFI